MPFFDGVTGPVYYRHWGARRRAAGLVFLHGFGEHSGLYHRFAADLNYRGISVWALDEIGHGLTGGQRGRVDSVEDLAENGRALIAIAQAQAPGLPIALAGHSLGGVTAALIAATAATSAGAGPGLTALVLSGTPVTPLQWLRDIGDDGDVSLDPGGLSAEPAYLDALASDPLAFTEAEAVFPGRALEAAWDRLSDAFAAVTLPVLFVHGALDPVVPAGDSKAWARRLRNGHIAEFARSRHDVLNDVEYYEAAAGVADFVLGAGTEAAQ